MQKHIKIIIDKQNKGNEMLERITKSELKDRHLEGKAILAFRAT